MSPEHRSASRIVNGAPVTGHKASFAREQRRAPTPSERLAWSLLRNRQCLGLKLRRQQVIGCFIVDFYCAALRIAIEIDGGAHQDPAAREYDRARDIELAARDVRVLRIQAAEVGAERFRALLTPYVIEAPLSQDGRGGNGAPWAQRGG